MKKANRKDPGLLKQPLEKENKNLQLELITLLLLFTFHYTKNAT